MRGFLTAAAARAPLALPGPANAAPPVNDDLGGAAAVVSLPFSATVDLTEATSELSEPACTAPEESWPPIQPRCIRSTRGGDPLTGRRHPYDHEETSDEAAEPYRAVPVRSQPPFPVSALAAQTPGPVRIAVHLTASRDGVTGGTFVATGFLGDSGTAPALERFPALRRGLRGPVVVHCAESLAGLAGSIAIAYDGVFHPVAEDVFGGRGVWRVNGGDHAYECLEAEGTWTATAVFGEAGLTLDTVFEGRGALRAYAGRGERL